MGIKFQQFPPPLPLHARIVQFLTPGAVIGAVQIDPGDQPVPGFGVELDVVMPLLEHLHKLRGVGVELHRLEHVVIAFDAGAAYVAVQLGVADGKFPGMAVIQLRINCIALPSASSGWSETGTLAGM